MGVSGEQIRREQEESRRRSKPGGKPIPKPRLASRADGFAISELLVAWAAWALGQRELAIALYVFLWLLGLLTVAEVRARAVEGGARVEVRPFGWIFTRRRTDVILTGAVLRYWNAAFNGGFELRAADGSLVVTCASRGYVNPLAGVQNVLSQRPPLRLTARGALWALPNWLAMGACIALLWNREVRLLPILCLGSMVSTFARALTGGSYINVEARRTLLTARPS